MQKLTQLDASGVTIESGAWDKAWADVQSLRPIIEAHKVEAEHLRRLPTPVAAAFLERDVYRLMLPRDLGGAGLTPLQHFKLIVEVSRSDASAGWLYWLAGGVMILAGKAPPDVTAAVFATNDCGWACGLAPTGRAVATEGGYRVSGRWAWASGINQTPYVGANCLVFDGNTPRMGSHGGPTLMMVVVPQANVRVLDTWHPGGMRGTGSTEFELDDHFVPAPWAFPFIGGDPMQPHPLFKLPPTITAFGIAAVGIGLAYSTIEALKKLALTKKLPPPRGLLAEQASLQYTIAKTEAMVDAVEASMHDSLSRAWDDVSATGEVALQNRARFRRAVTHAVDTCIEAVGMCYRDAGGSAVHESEPFERALRDCHTIGAHIGVQRGVMEQAGAVALGVTPVPLMF
jgi:alkylation response protein AidB-like acyl-CoA dehydrogenase